MLLFARLKNYVIPMKGSDEANAAVPQEDLAFTRKDCYLDGMHQIEFCHRSRITKPSKVYFQQKHILLWHSVLGKNHSRVKTLLPRHTKKKTHP
jgi:hypothetical protein